MSKINDEIEQPGKNQKFFRENGNNCTGRYHLLPLICGTMGTLLTSCSAVEPPLSEVNIGSFTATNTPLEIQVCKNGVHKGEFSVVRGAGTLYCGKTSGRNKDEIYFYVPVELKVTCTDREIQGIRMQDRFIEPSPYCFAVSEAKENADACLGEMTDRLGKRQSGLKPGRDLQFNITSGFQTYLLDRTISKRFEKLLTDQPGCGNEAKFYFLIAPAQNFSVDEMKQDKMLTVINLVLYTYHPATRLKAGVAPGNKAGDLIIEIRTRLVDEKNFLKNLPE
ncbi:MAG: hypothetical protein PHV82_02490 [Victivallaceae bacterium]|nr:hypothetical protein [Victivallaceae bacterium]